MQPSARFDVLVIGSGASGRSQTRAAEAFVAFVRAGQTAAE